MIRPKQILWFAGALFAVVMISALVAPKVSAALKGALVEVILPSRPFSDSLHILSTSPFAGLATGPGAGSTLGVTSITISNFDFADQQIGVYLPAISNSSCSSTILSEGSPYYTMIAPARKTVQFNYPTPLVFSGGCVVAQVVTTRSSEVIFDITGFIN